MQTLGNMVLGAVLAGVLAGPPVWSGADRLLQVGISEARVMVGAGNTGTPLHHALTALRSALPDAAETARLPN
ncbi:MAG TPA: hypothetical protein VGG10_16650 [Rhizomicrobium sp.]|jgi:hypothetical protein